jgi:SAM-dependent methyltransferase
MTDKSNTNDAVSHFSSYVKQFHAYYADRPEFQERLEIWRGLLDKYSVPGGLSVDMGCGTGIFSFYLAHKEGRVVGVDGAPDMVAFCESQRIELGLTNIEFFQARLPVVEDESRVANADLLIGSSVVEYVPDLEAALALFSRLLKPHGSLILSMPNVWCINRMWERAKHALVGEPQIYRHIIHFTSPHWLERRVRPLGFHFQEARYYTHYTRLAQLTRRLRLPLPLTEDLFVAVFRKS